MSAIAEILKQAGHTVTGSDSSASAVTQHLIERGIPVYIGHRAEQISGADIIVYTAAIHSDNPELATAREKGIPTYERCTVLGELMKSYRYPILVSGTHGKTTTTSMLTTIFLEADTDPTVLVGGTLSDIDGNLRVGADTYFISEACEYVESFLSFFPYLAIILDVEEDHLDYFRDLDHIISAFHRFGALVPNEGAVVVNGDDKNAMAAVRGLSCNIITAGLDSKNDYYATDITFDERACAHFTVCGPDNEKTTVQLSVPGIHNVSNALCAFAAAKRFGLESNAIAGGLKRFGGADRRFQFKGDLNGVAVYDDYAHHPTEIETTLKVGSAITKGQLFIVFQPHTYTRTKALFRDFAEVLSKADRVILADIYAAREPDRHEVSSADLAREIPGAINLHQFSEIADYLKAEAKAGDTIITVGAGDVFRIGE
ncbi:MAG: UDP-N-acetylmuramate--L-alanine ligase, partial [Clostridia bacterium]|nr:UDP-N-acetylmuramate--L-alanine ligase [Clostridia bacterium]